MERVRLCDIAKSEKEGLAGILKTIPHLTNILSISKATLRHNCTRKSCTVIKNDTVCVFVDIETFRDMG